MMYRNRPMDVPAVTQRPALIPAKGVRPVATTSILPAIRSYESAGVTPVRAIVPGGMYDSPFAGAPSSVPARQAASMYSSANPRAIPAVFTVGASAAARPTSVPAALAPSWPAPSSVAAMPISKTAARALSIERSAADRVIGASIFGGAVTEGDPEVGLAHISPYREPSNPVEKPDSENLVNKGEGWTDVFDISHGYALPRGRGMGMGRGAFNAQPRLDGFGQEAPAGQPPSEVKTTEATDSSPASGVTTGMYVGLIAAGACIGAVWILSRK